MREKIYLNLPHLPQLPQLPHLHSRGALTGAIAFLNCDSRQHDLKFPRSLAEILSHLAELHYINWHPSSSLLLNRHQSS